jgi:diguanylate cyclase (GGDEF)-like protein
VIDLDHFKYINDSVGHSAGDTLITQTAEIFRERLRTTDVIARLGGDEFAVILPEVQPGEARHVAINLLQALRAQTRVESPFGPRRVTASLGVAPFANAENVSGEELLVEADIAMYDAKDAGRDRVAMHNPTEDRQSLMHARLTWADWIRSAIDEDRFVLHAQPILSLTGDEPPRHELLIPMVGDDGDAIPPGTSCTSPSASTWSRTSTVGCCARRSGSWPRSSAGNDIRLDVNISAKSLISPDLSTVVANQLDATGADGRGLCLEITETVAIVSIDRAKRFASEIGELGCEVALDDFGAGFASFYYLKHLTFDYVKIDGEFIAGLPENRTNQLVVRSIVDIARGMGKRTIAEFVGDAATLALLRSYGVDYAQGYHVAMPRAFASGDLSRAATVEAA